MKIIISLIWICLLFACQQSQKKSTTATETSSEKPDSNIVASKKPDTLLPEKIAAKQLPAALRFRGKAGESWKWNDQLGENLLITTTVSNYLDKTDKYTGDPGYTAELHVFHFLKKDTGYQLLWKISDAVKSCSFDITASFFDDAIKVTDLDKNGIAESTVLYKLSCRSDVSPDEMKLIMHEGEKKYSLRGLTCDPGSPGICVSEKELDLEKQPAAKGEWEEYTRQAGRYRNEKEFANAPASFITWARSQWYKHIGVRTN